MNRTTIICVLFALLGACATPDEGRGPGRQFNETRLDRNVYRVSFKDDGKSSPLRATEQTLLRSAELTLSAGYLYFAIVDPQSETVVGRPWIFAQPAPTNTIVMTRYSNEIPGIAYDARVVLGAVGPRT
jgi:hypothetical protein